MIPEFDEEEFDDNYDDGINIDSNLFDTDFDDVGFYPEGEQGDNDADAAELFGY